LVAPQDDELVPIRSGEGIKMQCFVFVGRETHERFEDPGRRLDSSLFRTGSIPFFNVILSRRFSRNGGIAPKEVQEYRFVLKGRGKGCNAKASMLGLLTESLGRTSRSPETCG
jgi:hypothetical protein